MGNVMKNLFLVFGKNFFKIAASVIFQSILIWGITMLTINIQIPVSQKIALVIDWIKLVIVFLLSGILQIGIAKNLMDLADGKDVGWFDMIKNSFKYFGKNLIVLLRICIEYIVPLIIIFTTIPIVSWSELYIEKIPKVVLAVNILFSILLIITPFWLVYITINVIYMPYEYARNTDKKIQEITEQLEANIDGNRWWIVGVQGLVLVISLMLLYGVYLIATYLKIPESVTLVLNTLTNLIGFMFLQISFPIIYKAIIDGEERRSKKKGVKDSKKSDSEYRVVE